MAISLGELAETIGASLHGDPGTLIHQFASLASAKTGDITFFLDRKFRTFLLHTTASAVILQSRDLDLCPTGALVTDDPYLGYAKVASALHGARITQAGVDSSAQVAVDVHIAPTVSIGALAVIEAGVTLGDHVLVGPGCVVGRDVQLGAHTCLVANVTLGSGIRLGQRCIVHPGAVLGADGFGLAQEDDRWFKIPQIGSLSLGNDVEIGANTTIDRGSLGDTIIEDGVKIDNLVQIGHNVQVGANTAIAGCAGISGSTNVGKRCKIGGGAGLAGHLQVVDDVIITGMSLVTKSITKPGVYSSGWPSRGAREWRRTVGHVHRASSKHRRLDGPEGGNG